MTAALELFNRTFPNAPPQRIRQQNYYFVALARTPVVRVPMLSRRFLHVKEQNAPSFMMQATGRQLPRDQACDKCKGGNGIYMGCCVVSENPVVQAVTQGACALCWYGRQGSTCSFRPKFKGETCSFLPASSQLVTFWPL